MLIFYKLTVNIQNDKINDKLGLELILPKRCNIFLQNAGSNLQISKIFIQIFKMTDKTINYL